MLLYHSKSSNPFFNIATEEYFLKNFEEDVFMLYINEPSIIVGKHQNTLAEINYKFVKDNQIKVVRRLSGGGTVFHDFGNLNFCFIQKGEKDKLVDFKKFTKPILEVLNELNVPAKFAGKSDLVIENKKISGNAEHVFRNKVMHHGTILYNSKIKDLSDAIRVDPFKYEDKAVKSNRSLVTNVTDYLNHELSIENFIFEIFQHIKNVNEDSTNHKLSETDTANIQELITSKYEKWEWNFGYSPKYQFKKEFQFNNDFLNINFIVEKGIIHSVKSNSNIINLTEIFGELENEQHKEAAILRKLSSIDKDQEILGMSIDQLVEQLF
jgi:lipoate---protein ligase